MHGDILREVTISFITSTILRPQENSREGTQLHLSTENWIKDLLSMAPHIKTRPSFPHSQSLPSGSFHEALILIRQNENCFTIKNLQFDSLLLLLLPLRPTFNHLFLGFCSNLVTILTFPVSVQFSSLTQLCLTLCDTMNCSMPGLPVHHQLPEFTQTQVHRVSDAIQPSHPLSSPSPPAPNPSQHHSLFQ